MFGRDPFDSRSPTPSPAKGTCHRDAGDFALTKEFGLRAKIPGRQGDVRVLHDLSAGPDIVVYVRLGFRKLNFAIDLFTCNEPETGNPTITDLVEPHGHWPCVSSTT